MKALDILVRRVTVDGHVAPDGRLVVRDDGRAALVQNAGGVAVAAVSGVAADDWETFPDGRLVVRLDDGGTWSMIRDTRCGSCGGRFQLRSLDVAPLFPATEPSPDTAYQDTY